jgi:hypothetical protein
MYRIIMLERERDDLFEASVNCRVQKVKPVKHLETFTGSDTQVCKP